MTPGQARRKYHFDDGLRERLRAAYRAGNKTALTRELDRLQRDTRWPRWAFKCEARRLGIESHDHRRMWTAEEDALLFDRLGHSSTKRIAKLLGRSVESVQGRVQTKGWRAKVTDGYTTSDLMRCFGAARCKVEGWMRRGLLGSVHQVQGHRVTDANVRAFIRRYPDEYDLRCVSQDWFLAMALGGK